MNILVTGAAGFIGSNFVRWLLANHLTEVEKVIAYDALTYAGRIENLDGLDTYQQFKFVKGDIRDDVLLLSLFEQEEIQYIVNFAAESHVDRSISDPLAFVRTNIEGTQVLLNAGMSFGIKRHLQISTDECYGSLGAVGRFTETSPLEPSSAYSASKTAADLLALATYKTHNYNVVVTRCSNNYGPYQFPEKVIPLFITNALEDIPLPLYGDGKNVRSWIHVDDHSRAIWLALTKGRAGEVYNIGGRPEDEIENVTLTKMILEILQKPQTLIKKVEDRKGHDRRYAVDYTKIKNELGWEPHIVFKTGLEQTVQWYVKNEKWWRELKK